MSKVITEVLDALFKVMTRGSSTGMIEPDCIKSGTVSNGASTLTTLRERKRRRMKRERRRMKRRRRR